VRGTHSCFQLNTSTHTHTHIHTYTHTHTPESVVLVPTAVNGEVQGRVCKRLHSLSVALSTCAETIKLTLCHQSLSVCSALVLVPQKHVLSEEDTHTRTHTRTHTHTRARTHTQMDVRDGCTRRKWFLSGRALYF